MIVNFGFFISKFLRAINRPALRGCKIDKTAKVGTGSNCINVQMGRYSYMGKNYPLNKTVDDMYLFFCKYLRRTDAE